MKLALLGADDQTLELVREIGMQTPHEVVWGSELEDQEAAIRAIVPRMRAGEHWELLLGGTIADAVIVARHPDQEVRVEQLRKLLQAGVPSLVMHPICRSMLLAYELEMIRADTKTVIVPYLPDRLHPEINQLRGLVQQPDGSEIDTIEQVLFERNLRERLRDTVAAQFARDVDLLQAVCGELNKMSAQRGSDDTSKYANLAVQMSGAAGVPVRWTAGPAEGKVAGRLTIVGSQGRVILVMPDDGSPWHLIKPASNPWWSDSKAMLQALQQAIADEPSECATWNDACRAIEMAETIERCLKRGRTIDLQREEFSEENTFKGTMTSLGCGLLVGGVAFAFFAAALQTVFKMFGWKAGAEFLNKWPYLLVAFCVIFLLLQGLLAVARPKGDAGQREEPGAIDDGVGKSEA